MAHLNLDETREWLEIIYGDVPGYMHICSTGDWDGMTFTRDEIDQALRYVNHLDGKGREGIYARACTLRQPPRPGSRGGDELSFFLPGLWADLDIAGPGHKTTQPLPATEDEAMQIVEAAGLPAPSHWIHSGGGLYAWWLLYEPVEIDDLESFRALSSGWQKCLEHGAKKLGLHYGSGVGDLSRVLRLPGTVNRKAGLERPCTGLYPHSWSGSRFTFDQLQQAMIEASPPPPPPPEPLPLRDPNELRPGDIFNATTQWVDVLPAGWTWVYRRGDKWHLRRPGKDGRGISATISLTTDRFYPFTDAAAPFEPLKHYSKFEAYTLLEHNGDFSAAASELARRGLGTRPDSYTCGVLEVSQPPSPGVRDESLAQASTAGVEVDTPATVATEAYGIPLYSNQVFRDMNNWDGDGISEFWARLHAGTFRYVGSDKRWCHWNGVRWEQAEKEREVLAARAMTAKMRDHAVLVLAEAQRSGDEERIKEAKARLKEAKRATQSGYAGPLLSMARTDPRISAGWEDFDRRRELITLDNGVLNLDTFEFTPHDPSLMLTRKVNARYDPDKKEGRFTRFMEEVLPNQEVREFLQRACGYALTGNADDRVLIQLYGPSGSGKSQFMKAVFNVMGDFAKRSSDTAFQARSNGYKGPSEDLHSLRGSRFAMMPELDEGFRMNVALIKQLTGGDPLTTRKLYGQEVTWRPEFTVFMITNHLPRVAAGEDAYWNRVKPIKFGEVFVNSMGETLRPEDRNLGERMAAEEPEVILNWLLEGLKNYRERGLDAPEQITQWRDDYRDDVDTVRQFLHEAPGEGRIEIAEKASVPVRQMHLAYRSWCADNEVTPLGMRKFNERVESAGYQKHRKSQGYVWQGIGLAGWLGEAVAPNLSVYRGGNRWEPRN